MFATQLASVERIAFDDAPPSLVLTHRTASGTFK